VILPENIVKILASSTFNKIKNTLLLIEIAQYFKKYGYYPKRTSQIKESIKLRDFLSIKRKAYKDYINGTNEYGVAWYPSDIEVAKTFELPDDWMLTRDCEKYSNKKVIELAEYFEKYGSYPKHNSTIGRFLKTKRENYKHYICGNITTGIWHQSDIQIAKIHKLPDNWINPKNMSETEIKCGRLRLSVNNQ
jgi:hypothetical protein